MKHKVITFMACLLLSASMMAQTQVTAGMMYGKKYGVTYMLPQTMVNVKVIATKHTYTPGEFCKYADRYLRLKDVSADENVYWTIEKIQAGVVGVPDKDNVYFVELKDKTVAPLMELTGDGVVRSINMPFSGAKKDKPAAAPKAAKVDPKQYLTEEILMSNSTAKMAELVAKEIYNIRESKNALLRGEADNMPKDGEQLKVMLDNLNKQETALTEMFSGSTVTEEKVFDVQVTPKEMTNEIALRFSKNLGLVANNDLAGEPVYITLKKVDMVDEQAKEEAKKKSLEGIAYNVPGRAKVALTYKNQTLFDGELPITQFGTVEYLAPVLFNKTTTTKVLFNTETGALIKVDRGEVQ